MTGGKDEDSHTDALHDSDGENFSSLKLFQEKMTAKKSKETKHVVKWLHDKLRDKDREIQELRSELQSTSTKLSEERRRLKVKADQLRKTQTWLAKSRKESLQFEEESGRLKYIVEECQRKDVMDFANLPEGEEQRRKQGADQARLIEELQLELEEAKAVIADTSGRLNVADGRVRRYERDAQERDERELEWSALLARANSKCVALENTNKRMKFQIGLLEKEKTEAIMELSRTRDMLDAANAKLNHAEGALYRELQDQRKQTESKTRELLVLQAAFEETMIRSERAVHNEVGLNQMDSLLKQRDLEISRLNQNCRTMESRIKHLQRHIDLLKSKLGGPSVGQPPSVASRGLTMDSRAARSPVIPRIATSNLAGRPSGGVQTARPAAPSLPHHQSAAANERYSRTARLHSKAGPDKVVEKPNTEPIPSAQTRLQRISDVYAAPCRPSATGGSRKLPPFEGEERGSALPTLSHPQSQTIVPAPAASARRNSVDQSQSATESLSQRSVVRSVSSVRTAHSKTATPVDSRPVSATSLDESNAVLKENSSGDPLAISERHQSTKKVGELAANEYQTRSNVASSPADNTPLPNTASATAGLRRLVPSSGGSTTEEGETLKEETVPTPPPATSPSEVPDLPSLPYEATVERMDVTSGADGSIATANAPKFSETTSADATGNEDVYNQTPTSRLGQNYTSSAAVTTSIHSPDTEGVADTSASNHNKCDRPPVGSSENGMSLVANSPGTVATNDAIGTHDSSSSIAPTFTAVADGSGSTMGSASGSPSLADDPNPADIPAPVRIATPSTDAALHPVPDSSVASDPPGAGVDASDVASHSSEAFLTTPHADAVDPEPTPNDANSDPTPTTQVATPNDASLTPVSDAVANAASDAAPDAVSEGTLNAALDAALDTTPDASPEAAPDAALGADSEVAPDATLDSASDAAPGALNATPDTALDTDVDAVLGATPDSATVAAGAAPDAVPEFASDVTAALDASPDTVPDVELDIAAPDAVPDAAPDSVPDATPDAVPDATPVATPDATLDTDPDVTPDVAPDVAPGTAPEASSDVVNKSTSDLALNPAHTLTPDPVPVRDAGLDAGPDTASDALATISVADPDAGPDATSDVDPGSEAAPDRFLDVAPDLACPEVAPEAVDATAVATSDVFPTELHGTEELNAADDNVSTDPLPVKSFDAAAPRNITDCDPGTAPPASPNPLIAGPDVLDNSDAPDAVSPVFRKSLTEALDIVADRGPRRDSLSLSSSRRQSLASRRSSLIALAEDSPMTAFTDDAENQIKLSQDQVHSRNGSRVPTPVPEDDEVARSVVSGNPTPTSEGGGSRAE
eukprot:Rmarinus@m.9336